MKFGVAGANAGRRARPENAVEFARLAEESGFESLWTVEHVVVPAGYRSRYPYSDDGRMPGKEEVSIADPLIWMAFAAAVTRTINLATGILILPQRNPVILAKEVASLDVLAGGRVILGVGIGWLREEFEAIGVPFTERGARTDEYVEALRTLWREPEPTFAGRFARFEQAKSYPKPARPEGPPIVVGGHTDAAARRAGRLGDGFFPWATDPDAIRPLIDTMRGAAREAGRDPDAIEVTAGAATDLEGARRYAGVGVHRIVIPALGGDTETIKRFLGDFGEQVIAPLS